MLGHILTLDPAFFLRMPTGEVLSRLTTDLQIVETLLATSVSFALRNILLLLGSLGMLLVVSPRLTGLVLPKADSAAALAELEHWLGPAQQRAGLPAGKIKVLPLVTETPASLFNLGTYAGSSPRLAAMTWGAEDLSAAIGAITARTPDGAYTPLYDLARSLCLAGAAAAGVPAIETVYPDFRDLDGLAAYAARGRRDGFVGMMAIHPSQVAPINAAFTPAAEEIAEAQAIVDLFEANPGAGTLALNGRMVDQPHLLQSLRLLQRVR